MKKISVTLGMLVRTNKTIVVEVPDDFDLEDATEMMGEVYNQDDGENFEDDTEWGVEEGTHSCTETAEGPAEYLWRDGALTPVLPITEGAAS